MPKMAAACEPKLEAEELEMKMLPVVQSGGIYDLKWTAQVTRLILEYFTFGVSRRQSVTPQPYTLIYGKGTAHVTGRACDALPPLRRGSLVG